MELEKMIQEAVTESIKNIDITKLIQEQLEKSLKEVIENAFRWNGTCKKAIEEQIEKTMNPVIEKYNFDEYIPKLNGVLTQIVNSTELVDNKTILDNFKNLMKDQKDEFKLSDIYNEWVNEIKEHAETDNLEIDYDDEISYSPFTVNMIIEECDYNHILYSGEDIEVKFECEQDENMNMTLKFHKYNKSTDENKWYFDGNYNLEIQELRTASKLQILLSRISRSYKKIEFDIKDIIGEKVIF